MVKETAIWQGCKLLYFIYNLLVCIIFFSLSLPALTVLCEDITIPSSGTYSSSTDGETTTVTFTCDPGTTLKGNQHITCGPAGTFQQVEPTCGKLDETLPDMLFKS